MSKVGRHILFSMTVKLLFGLLSSSLLLTFFTSTILVSVVFIINEEGKEL